MPAPAQQGTAGAPDKAGDFPQRAPPVCQRDREPLVSQTEMDPAALAGDLCHAPQDVFPRDPAVRLGHAVTLDEVGAVSPTDDPVHPQPAMAGVQKLHDVARGQPPCGPAVLRSARPRFRSWGTCSRPWRGSETTRRAPGPRATARPAPRRTEADRPVRLTKAMGVPFHEAFTFRAHTRRPPCLPERPGPACFPPGARLRAWERSSGHRASESRGRD